jgi:hypothetical protein
MAASSTTRRGNGGGNAPGYGGPKRDGISGSKTRTPSPGRTPGVKNGEGKAAVKEATFRAALAPYLTDIADQWRLIALQPGHPHQHTMIIKAAELAGEMKQTVDLNVKSRPAADLTDDELAAEFERSRRADAG